LVLFGYQDGFAGGLSRPRALRFCGRAALTPSSLKRLRLPPCVSVGGRCPTPPAEDASPPGPPEKDVGGATLVAGHASVARGRHGLLGCGVLRRNLGGAYFAHEACAAGDRVGKALFAGGVWGTSAAQGAGSRVPQRGCGGGAAHKCAASRTLRLRRHQVIGARGRHAPQDRRRRHALQKGS
jgi:hypothetical protein